MHIFRRIRYYITNPRLVRRALRFTWQRLTRGWSDADTWNLDVTMARFIHPRLVRFKELNNGYPGDITWEEWNEILDDMIYAMEICSDDDFTKYMGDNEVWERVERGTEYLGEYFRALWW